MILFNNKNDFEDLEEYEEYEDNENDLSSIQNENDFNEDNDIPRIIKSYPSDEEEFNTLSIDDEYDKKYENKIKKIINAIFIVIVTILSLILIDVIMVTKLGVGPFFTIRTKVYKDGGTKEYYGIGYKVIKYNQIIGRRDIEFGNWNLKYNTKKTDISDIDLSIEFVNDYEKTTKKYYHTIINVSSTIKRIDINHNSLVLEYFDEDSKYTLRIYCSMVKDTDLTQLNIDDKVSVLGTVNSFSIKNNNYPNSIYLKNCFIQ